MDDTSQGLEHFLQHWWLPTANAILFRDIDDLISVVLTNTTFQKYYKYELKPDIVRANSQNNNARVWRNYKHKALTIFRLFGCTHAKDHDKILIHIRRNGGSYAIYQAYINNVMRAHGSRKMREGLERLDTLSKHMNDKITNISISINTMNQIHATIYELVYTWLSFFHRRGSMWRCNLLAHVFKYFVDYRQFYKMVAIYGKNDLAHGGLLSFLLLVRRVAKESNNNRYLVKAIIPHEFEKNIYHYLSLESIENMIRCVLTIQNKDLIEYLYCPLKVVSTCKEMIMIRILDGYDDFDQMYNHLKQYVQLSYYIQRGLSYQLFEIIGKYLDQNLLYSVYKLVSLCIFVPWEYVPTQNNSFFASALDRISLNNTSMFWENLKFSMTSCNATPFSRKQENVMKNFWYVLTTKDYHSYHESVVSYGAPEEFEFVVSSHSSERFIVFDAMLKHLGKTRGSICSICSKTRDMCFNTMEPSFSIFPEYKYVKQGDKPMVLLY
jgi:hypothetical protein